MVRLLALAVSVLAATVAIPALADGGLPQPFTARFALESFGAKVGVTRWTLEHLGDGRFLYTSRSEPAGFVSLLRKEHIVERSESRVASARVQPLDYRYTRTGGRKERDVRVTFDWDEHVARNTMSGRTWQMPIPAGTLDKLNYVIAMMSDLANGDRNLTYEIADGGKLKTYSLETVGEERIDTVLGPVDALKVVRRRDDSARETTMWCPPALGFLPVRIEHREPDGAMVTLELESVEGLAKP